jgi:hypothetical protein
VFTLVFGGSEKELHVREIQRRFRLNDRALRRELEKPKIFIAGSDHDLETVGIL